MRVGLRVHVGGRQHRHDLSPFVRRTPPRSTSLRTIARLGELHRRDEAQELLDGEIGAAPVLFEPVAQLGILQSSKTDPLIRCVVVSEPAPSSRNTIATISSRADPAAFLLDPDKLGDQPLAAMCARGLQARFQIALHRQDRRNQAEEAERAGEAGEAARPGDEFRPVGRRQAEQLADDRERQLSCIALDEIGRASLGKQLVGESVRERKMCGSMSRMARRRKASSTISRSRVWSGSSIVSMLLASVRTMPGIHHRSPATCRRPCAA